MLSGTNFEGNQPHLINADKGPRMVGEKWLFSSHSYSIRQTITICAGPRLPSPTGAYKGAGDNCPSGGLH